jgi:transcriptional regulator with XRE-family HTH domain
MRIGLKLAIIQAGKTQRQVASESDIPENRLSELVRGWAEPRDSERAALAHVLNRTVEDLFTAAPPSEIHVRGVLDGLQSAIVHADAMGAESVLNDLCAVKLRAAREFAKRLESGQ